MCCAGAEDRLDVGEGVENAVGGFVENMGYALASLAGDELFEGGFALPCFGGEKAVEGESLGWEAAGDQRADGGVRAGNREDVDAGGDGGCGDLSAGVGDARCAGIADDGDPCTLFQVCDEFLGAGALVVHVVADGGGVDLEVIEQLLGLPRVLAGDAIRDCEERRRRRRVMSSRFADRVAPPGYSPGASGASVRATRVSSARSSLRSILVSCGAVMTFLRRCIQQPMEWARFCGVMMPTMRSPSSTGTICAPCARHDAAQRLDQRIVGLRGLEGARHDALHIAVAVGMQRLDDALAGDGADEVGSANDGEDVLQRVDRPLQRIFERVGGGEHAELRQHHVAHPHGVDIGLQQQALVFHVGADQHEAADHDQPHVGNQKASDHESDSDGLTESCCCARALDAAFCLGKLAAEDAAAVERRGGQQIHVRPKED